MNEGGMRTEGWRAEPRGSRQTIGPMAPHWECGRTHTCVRAGECVCVTHKQHTHQGNGSAVLLECKGRHT